MANGFEPFEKTTAPGGDAPPMGVPFARPVESWVAPGLLKRPHAFLLLDITSGTALVDIAATVLLLLVAWLIAELAAGGLIMVLLGWPGVTPGVDLETLGQLAFMPSLSFRAFASLVIIAAVVASRGQTARSVGLGWSDLAVNLLLGGLAMVTSYGLIMVWQVVVWFCWPELMEQMNANVDRLLALVPKAHPLTFGALALTVGVYEELIFRGFIMPRLRRATGSWVIAVVISTALFTVPHMLEQTVGALIPITILSVVFSLVTVWRKSVIPAIVGHFLFDWSQFIGLYVLGGESWT